ASTWRRATTRAPPPSSSAASRFARGSSTPCSPCALTYGWASPASTSASASRPAKRIDSWPTNGAKLLPPRSPHARPHAGAAPSRARSRSAIVLRRPDGAVVEGVEAARHLGVRSAAHDVVVPAAGAFVPHHIEAGTDHVLGRAVPPGAFALPPLVTLP